MRCVCRTLCLQQSSQPCPASVPCWPLVSARGSSWHACSVLAAAGTLAQGTLRRAPFGAPDEHAKCARARVRGARALACCRAGLLEPAAGQALWPSSIYCRADLLAPPPSLWLLWVHACPSPSVPFAGLELRVCAGLPLLVLCRSMSCSGMAPTSLPFSFLPGMNQNCFFPSNSHTCASPTEWPPYECCVVMGHVWEVFLWGWLAAALDLVVCSQRCHACHAAPVLHKLSCTSLPCASLPSSCGCAAVRALADNDTLLCF